MGKLLASYHDDEGHAYELTGEARQVSGGEYYLDAGKVRVCALIACYTPESYPVLRIVATGVLEKPAPRRKLAFSPTATEAA